MGLGGLRGDEQQQPPKPNGFGFSPATAVADWPKPSAAPGRRALLSGWIWWRSRPKGTLVVSVARFLSQRSIPSSVQITGIGSFFPAVGRKKEQINCCARRTKREKRGNYQQNKVQMWKRSLNKRVASRSHSSRQSSNSILFGEY